MQPVTWVDIDCGYGELLEAVSENDPSQSRVIGFKPLKPKALAAKSLGFEIRVIRYQGTDAFLNLPKNTAKRLLGRTSHLSIAYTSKYRQIQIRTLLKPIS